MPTSTFAPDPDTTPDELPVLTPEPWFIERVEMDNILFIGGVPADYEDLRAWRVFDENNFAVGFFIGFSPDEAQKIAEAVEIQDAEEVDPGDD
jgi:hypothetical protein